MTSMHLVLRPSTKVGHHPGRLFLRLIHKREIRTITLTGCYLYPEEWDEKEQKIIYPENNPNRVAGLEEIEQLINYEMNLVNTHLKFLQKKGRYSVTNLVKLYRQRKDSNKLLGYTATLIREMEHRGQHRTAKAYQTVANGIVKFNNDTDIPLTQINKTLIKDFEKHLTDTKKFPNTIAFYMRNLRAIFNKAIEEKRIIRPRENPFVGVCTGVSRTMKRALTLKEIKALHNLDLTKQSLESHEYQTLKNLYHAKSYFGFCFYARGMCFIDMAFLRKVDIMNGFICYVRRKTGQQIAVRITPEIQEIIDRFKEEVRNSPYVFPVIRDANKDVFVQYETALRMQNAHLKKIAKLAGIHKPISTHWARHSWATVAKYKNLPTTVISEGLGHTSERTTQIYLDSLDNALLDAANQIIISAVTEMELREYE